MAVLGRVVLVGLAAAGGYAAWRSLQQSGGATGTGVAGGTGRPIGGAGNTGGAGGTGSTGASGAAGSAAAAAAASAATMPDQSSPLPPDPTSGTTGTGTSDGATGSPGAGSGAAGTRGDDPLTGIASDPGGLPEPTATPDGTPAASAVETRRVGDDPA